MLKAKVSRTSALRFVLIAVVIIVPVAWVWWVTQAASRTWTGASINNPNPGLRNNFWSNNLNWSSNVAPVAGDDLVFPASIQPNTLNNFSNGTTFNSITVSGGHILTGSGVNLDAGLSATNAQINLSSITLNNSQEFNAPVAGAAAVVTSVIVTNGKTLNITGPGNYAMVGLISGSGVLQNTAGLTILTANNTYTGQRLLTAAR
jgi:hypothetical protein